MQKNKIIITVVGVALIAFIGLYLYRTSRVTEVAKDVSKTTTVGGVTAVGTGDFKIEQVGMDEGVENALKRAKSIPMPNLSRPIEDKNKQNPIVFQHVRDDIKKLTAELQKDPSQYNSWIALGVDWKLLGNYEAVAEILEYATKVWPGEFPAYANLADVYQFYLKDYPKAEKAWLQGIEVKPDYPQAYENLYTLYTTQYTEKTSGGLPILMQGVKNNPKSVDMLVYVARYYRKVGDEINTKLYYEKAISVATAEQQSALVVERDTVK